MGEAIHVIVPNDIDDPRTPSGGNVYDRRICRGLTAAGWSVREHAVFGGWPQPSRAELAELARVLADLDDDALVLLDGLIASAAPQVLGAQADRLRLVILVHLPLGHEDEGRALAAATAIVTTSGWSRRRLLELYPLSPDRVHVAPPGVDPAALVDGSPDGTELLCVAAVSPHKGHDVLLAALATITDRVWRCVCVGSLDRDPAFVERLREQARADGIADRISFVGPRTGTDLDQRYAAADLLVLASRGETYGMVVTEALARGIPVVAALTNGVPEALGLVAPLPAKGPTSREDLRPAELAPDGGRPGLLVEPDDPTGLAAALRRWLDEPELRQRLRRAARGRRGTLTGWATTTDLVATALLAASRSDRGTRTSGSNVGARP